MKEIGFIALSLIATSCLFAQKLTRAATNTIHLTGTVMDSLGSPLYPATIIYQSSLDTLQALSEADGSYSLSVHPDSGFTLLISMKGYGSYAHRYRPTSHTKALPPIMLHPSFGDLDPVTVTSIRPVTFTEDTLSYHVSAFPVPDGSEVIAILRRLPGIEVDANGNVSVQGKKIQRVLVNGKEFFGTDILLAIQNLPADLVDKLQVIDDYGDKARLTGVRSGDPAKILNIVLRSDKRKGQFGNIAGEMGSQKMYGANALANAFNGDLQLSARAGVSNDNPLGSDVTKYAGFNFANRWGPKWEAAFDLISVHSNPNTDIQTYSLSHYPSDTLQQVQHTNSSATNSTTDANSRIVFRPNNQSMLRLLLTGSASANRSHQLSEYNTAEQNSGFSKASQGTNVAYTTTKPQILNADLYFEQTLPTSRSRYSLEANVHCVTSGTTADNTTNATVTFDNLTTPSYLHQITSSTSHSWDTHWGGTYFFPLGSTTFLEAGYQLHTSPSNSHLMTLSADSIHAPLLPLDSLSQNDIERNVSHNIHLGYSGKTGKLDLSATIDAQPGQLQGTADIKGGLVTYRYFSILPSLQSAYKLDKTRSLHVYYSGSTTQPSITQLSPFVNLTNPQYPIVGNPHLQQSYTHNASMTYEQGTPKGNQFFGFVGSLNYAVTLHSIVKNLSTPKSNSQVVQSTSFLNAGSTNTLSLNYHLFFPSFVHKYLRVILNGQLSRQTSITVTDSIATPASTFSWTPSVLIRFYVPQIIESDISGSYGRLSTQYPGAMPTATVSQTANLSFDTRIFAGKKWVIRPQLYQTYTSNGERLYTVPTTFNSIVQRNVGKHNNIVISLSGLNLLDTHQSSSQTITPTTVTQTTPQLLGRYYLLQVEWKFKTFNQ